jgi:hypothetical protein
VVHCILAFAGRIGGTYSEAVALVSSAVAYTSGLEVQRIAVEASYQLGLVVNLETQVEDIVVAVVAVVAADAADAAAAGGVAYSAFGQGLAHI